MTEKCKKDNKVTICLRKVINVKSQHTALLCYNPRCVTEEQEKAIATKSTIPDQPRCTKLKVDIDRFYSG